MAGFVPPAASRESRDDETVNVVPVLLGCVEENGVVVLALAAAALVDEEDEEVDTGGEAADAVKTGVCVSGSGIFLPDGK